jgi:hypothetical protein
MTNRIYHYTDIDAMKNIIESKKIRATQANFLNDPSEINIGIDAITNYGSKKLKTLDGRPSDSQSEVCEWLFYKALSNCKSTIDRKSVYVSSFSYAPDLLTQWIMYASDGKGVSIAFDKERLEACLKKHTICPIPGPGYERFREVKYFGTSTRIPQRMISHIEEFKIDYIKEYLEDDCNLDYLDNSTEGRSDAKCIDLILTMKHKCYKQEKECRILAPRNGNKEIICQSTGDEKYLYIPTNDNAQLPITEIMVGPNYKPDEQKQIVADLKTFVTRQGLGTTKISRSVLPYRH